jgi:hypothetical protein
MGERRLCGGHPSNYRMWCLARSVAGDAVEVRLRDERRLDPLQAVVDSAPARGDQIDQQREVIEASMPIGQQLSLDTLEPLDRLRAQAARLGELPRDRDRLGPDSLADGGADPLWQVRFELGRGERERLDLGTRPFEGDLRGSGIEPLVVGLRESAHCPPDRRFVHGLGG